VLLWDFAIEGRRVHENRGKGRLSEMMGLAEEGEGPVWEIYTGPAGPVAGRRGRLFSRGKGV